MISSAAYTAKLTVSGSKHLALYQTIREAITEGQLSAGERLPSTRRLAALFRLSRGSVSLAYEMLAVEGLIQSGVGQGTFVAWWEEGSITSQGRLVEEAHEPLAEPALTAWARRLMAKETEIRVRTARFAAANPPIQLGEHVNPISFVPEGIGAGWFPWLEWKALVAKEWKAFGFTWKDTRSTEGSVRLRQAIANRLRLERGITCEADNIIITAGSMQAIALLTQLLLEEGKTAVVESPSYTGIPQAIEATGARLIAQEVDSNGIVPQEWEAQLLFVTPTRQFPTGAVLSYERRRALLAWASRRNAWIVEDDYDSEFRWGGRPIEPLKSLDREGRVIYVGTFSRSMCAGVRIGYAIVPNELVQPFICAKKLYDPYPSGIVEQEALATWMSEGGFDRHMRRMRRVYGKLEGKLRLGLEKHLGNLFDVVPSDAGLHVYVKWLSSDDNYRLLAKECSTLGVSWKEGSIYAVHGKDQNVLSQCSALFGFAHLDEERIDEGVARIRLAAEALGLISSTRVLGGTVDA